jgi:hypothetical protein
LVDGGHLRGQHLQHIITIRCDFLAYHTAQLDLAKTDRPVQAKLPNWGDREHAS